MYLSKIKNIINILFINKKSSRYLTLFLVITTILIPLDFLSLWMVANFTKFFSSELNRSFTQGGKQVQVERDS